ncbi:HNH endonuclease [Parabacteroides sp. AGMB00274]|uniref:Putative HNH nuclease YajD n=1 Tax=Parabacteroides faecalis TaxID=2924040 RepID=A0ABT0C111_9BACT|nr:HNH endonuclease signature motif containing protein [Parabacteroides faecalis]MCJ2380679.1 HNH endonuclease [Parabacteroides faecalis]
MATKANKRIRKYGWSGYNKRSEKMEDRPRSNDLYHTNRWTRESKAFRHEHPLCQECLKNEIYTPSEVVDHIIPIAVCDDFWDQSNWQALCRKCNIKKGNRDKKLINHEKAMERS